MSFRIGSVFAAGVDALGGYTATADTYGTKADTSLESLEVVKSGGVQPAIDVLAGISGSFTAHYLFDFYYKIWVVPTTLIAQNPKVNVGIPFDIWNAYPYPNTNSVTAIDNIDGDGMTFDLDLPDSFKRIEYRTVYITITPDAPSNIDAYYTFDFQYGEGFLHFIATIGDVLPIPPNVEIVESYNWLTNILEHYDGSEQRIALRVRPRRKLKYSLTILNDADRKALIDKIYKTATLTLLLPTYQNQSRVKQKALAGDSVIYTNTKRADIRPDERVIVITRSGESFVLKALNVFDDYVELTSALTSDIPAGAMVTNGFSGRFPDKSGLTMNAISGASELQFDIVEIRDQLQWPGLAIDLPTLYGTPILLKRALADNGAVEAFSTGTEVIDNQTGKPQYYTAWSQPYVEGRRAYLCQTLFEPDDYQFWLTFLEYCRGQQKPFYTPTYRNDLVWLEGSEVTQSKITVVGQEYGAQYFASETYKHIQIETSVGTFEVRADSVETDTDATTINFLDPIATDLTGVEIYRISFVLLVRLGSDEVTLTHSGSYSKIELDLKAISNANV